MREVPAGYRLLRSESASTCTLFYVSRFGRRYVLKQYGAYRFLSRESLNSATPELLEAEARARAFYEHLRRVMKLMRRHCRQYALLNVPLDVFRRGAFIYKATRMLTPCGIPTEALHERLTPRQMDVLLRTVITQLDQLRRMDFVHGDIKPENFVVQRKGGLYTASMIDFETGFVRGEFPEGWGVGYTPEFAAPEMIDYQTLAEDAPPEEKRRAFAALDCASDVFAAGCVIALMLTGRWPGWRRGEACFSPESLLRAELPVWIGDGHPLWRMLVREMIRYECRLRPDALALLEALAAADAAGLTQALSDPFAAVGGKYRFRSKAKGVGPDRMLLGERPGAGKGFFGRRKRAGESLCAVWHLDGCWSGGKDARCGASSLLKQQEKRAARRLEALDRTLAKLGKCAEKCGALLPAKLIFAGKLAFLEHKTPAAQWRTLGDLSEGLPSEEADRLFGELMDAVAALHGAGLLNCAVTAEDVWLYRGADGREHVFLARPQRLIAQDAVPEPEDIDLPAECAAPELMLYLGTRDAEMKATLRGLIGPWSDVFSMGMLYHRLLTGRVPAMPGRFPYAARAAQFGALQVSGAVDDGRRALLYEMLAFQPEDRPESMEALRAHFERRVRAQADDRADEIAEATIDQARRAGGSEPAPFDPAIRDEDGNVMIDFGWQSDPGSSEGGAVAAEGNTSGDSTRRVEDAVLDADGYVLLEDLPGTAATCAPDGQVEAEGWRFMERPPVGGLRWVWDGLTGRERLARRVPGGMTPAELAQGNEIAGRCADLMAIEAVAVIEGEAWAVFGEQPESLRPLRDAMPLSRDEAGRAILAALRAAQAFHEKGALCAPILPDDLFFAGERILMDGLRNTALPAAGASDQWAARAREAAGIGEWLAPETRPATAGARYERTPASDVYSLGLLFRWLLSGKKPGEGEGERPAVDPEMDFAARWLLLRMLRAVPDERPVDCGALAEEWAALSGRQGQSHSVTVKLNGVCAAGQPVRLYAQASGGDVFVASATTDRQGRAVFRGALPPLKYYVLCAGQRIACRWRNL